MISRQTREAAGGVLSFTFLDVLTCTMGCLVLLVVILGEKAADTRLEDALRNGPKKTGAEVHVPAIQSNPIAPIADDDPSKPGAQKVAEQLARLRKQESKLAALRRQAAERLDEETARVRHLEDHQRRLEHELAQLHIAVQRLEEAEKEQTVDQTAAERELERLNQLIADVEKQLQELRDRPAGEKSYAIIPYGGKNGTRRRPIYIECTADTAIIQPEGIELTKWDFDGPIRSGNPVASALRAAREELDQRARAAGEEEMPDAYPLLLVRPEGAMTYRHVVQAVRTWDVQFGYELIDSDWKLAYPEPDPRLAQVMSHAIDQARERQALLAKAAPRTYGKVPALPGGPPRKSNSVAANSAQESHGAAPEGTQPAGFLKSQANRQTPQLSFAEEVARTNETTRLGQVDRSGGPDAGMAGDGGDAATQQGQNAPTPTEIAAMPAGATSPSGAKSAMMPAPDVHKVAMERASDRPKPIPNDQEPPADEDLATSAAETRGSNWANAAARGRSTPVTRPIRVVVTAEGLCLPDESSDGGDSETATVSFYQPTDQVLDQLSAAVQNHVEQWGLAGKAMYWRPTLVLQVAPGAERHATRLNDLLQDSGIDIRRLEATARLGEEPTSATR